MGGRGAKCGLYSLSSYGQSPQEQEARQASQFRPDERDGLAGHVAGEGGALLPAATRYRQSWPVDCPHSGPANASQSGNFFAPCVYSFLQQGF